MLGKGTYPCQEAAGAAAAAAVDPPDDELDDSLLEDEEDDVDVDAGVDDPPDGDLAELPLLARESVR